MPWQILLNERVRTVAHILWWTAIALALYVYYVHLHLPGWQIGDTTGPYTAPELLNFNRYLPLTPFDDPSYTWVFAALLFVSGITSLLPRFRLARRWVVFATFAMIILRFAGERPILHAFSVNMYWIVFAYAIAQWGLARLLLSYRKKSVLYACIAVGAALPYFLLTLVYEPAGMPFFFAFIGIQLVTYRVFDVLFIIRDGLITELPFVDYATYLLFFATLPMGPVDRYRRFIGDLHHERTFAEFRADAYEGIRRIFEGFLYLKLCSPIIAFYILVPLAASISSMGVLTYTYLHLVWQFFNLAGASALAIGVSYVIGIHTPENVNKPLLSSNFQEFWNRWHMSVSWWYRDHIYSRIVYFALKRRWSVDPRLISYIAFVITFGLIGFVNHGVAGALYYGAYNSLLMIGYKIYAINRYRFTPILDVVPKRIRFVSAIAFTLLLVSAGETTDHWVPIVFGP